jgi:hypothetical protein
VGLPEHSTWARKIDWELNFQILRASKHQKPELSAELNQVLQKTGLEALTIDRAGSALLVAADLNLPCRWVLSLSKLDASSLLPAWIDLGRPKLRVFLPQTQSVETFAKEWDEVAGVDDFQIVLE